jgi:hypothetical protein
VSAPALEKACDETYMSMQCAVRCQQGSNSDNLPACLTYYMLLLLLLSLQWLLV